MSRTMSVLLKVVIVGAAAYAALLAVVFVLQKHLLYFPGMGREILRTPKDAGLDYESVWLTTVRYSRYSSSPRS